MTVVGYKYDPDHKETGEETEIKMSYDLRTNRSSRGTKMYWYKSRHFLSRPAKKRLKAWQKEIMKNKGGASN